MNVFYTNQYIYPYTSCLIHTASKRLLLHITIHIVFYYYIDLYYVHITNTYFIYGACTHNQTRFSDTWVSLFSQNTPIQSLMKKGQLLSVMTQGRDKFNTAWNFLSIFHCVNTPLLMHSLATMLPLECVWRTSFVRCGVGVLSSVVLVT